MAREIILTSGNVVLVDDEDFERLNRFRWHWHRDNNYAGRNVWGKDIKRARTIMMHRVIMEAPAGQEVDHKNGNGLDNRKANLRLVSHKQNSYNCKLRTDSTTGYRGVTFVRGKYIAQIQADKKHRHLGCFTTAIDAALAYNRAALELHGEHARLNTIPGESEPLAS